MMCAAACELTGVGAVAFIAPDPSDDDGGEDPDGIETEWVIAANLLFLSGVAANSGSSSSMIARAGQREPEITHLNYSSGGRLSGNAKLPSGVIISFQKSGHWGQQVSGLTGRQGLLRAPQKPHKLVKGTENAR